MQDNLQKINDILSNKDFIENKDSILSLISDPQLAHYFFTRFPKVIDGLSKMEFLLDAMLETNNHYTLTQVLTESISDNNNAFIIEYIDQHYEDFGKSKFRDDLYQEEALKVVTQIIESDKTHHDKIFELVKKVLTLSGNEYKEDRYDHKREKDYVAKLMLYLWETGEQKEEILKLVGQKFDLTSGGFGLLMNTPKEIFQILETYLNENFKTNLADITSIVIEQYDERYDGEYKGWEWAGAGVSRSGSNFSLNDINIVIHVLEPATKKFYEEEQDFEFVKEAMITKTEDVSKNRPDFLNRAVLPVILRIFKTGKEQDSDKAYEIINEFIESRKGIPHKAALIYQAARTMDLSTEKLWSLAKIHAEKYETPTSVFLEQIVSDLSVQGHKQAKQILKKWHQNPKYYQGFGTSNTISQSIVSKLDDNFDGAVEQLKEFINNEGFTNDSYDWFEVFDLARTLSRILEKNVDVGLQILNETINKNHLGRNEQILITNAISNISTKELGVTKSSELLYQIYENYVFPFLGENNLPKIIQKINHDNAREQFVKFAELLLENGLIDKAIKIVEIFVSDPDPYLPEDDPNSRDTNEHARIERGEGDPTITSVRGWCAWVLMKSSTLKGRPYIDKIIDLVEKLTKDENYYVQHMACFALSQLANVRLTHIEGKKELFLDSDKIKALKKAKRIEKIAFDLLDRMAQYNSKPKKALAKSILSVFGAIRSLNQDDALRFTTTFHDNFPPEAIGEAAPLFIFFAEFRENAYKDWEWKADGLYDDLAQFDSTAFKKILENLAGSNNVEIRKQFAFKFSVLPDEGEELFDVSLKYLNIIADQEYDDDVFRAIFTYFVPRQIDKHFEETYALWKKCIEKEVKALNKNYEKKIPNSVPNWIEQYHGDILLKIKDEIGEETFLTDLELFTKFPKGVNLYGIASAIGILRNFAKDNKKVEEIYDSLIERDPAYYDTKQEWMNK